MRLLVSASSSPCFDLEIQYSFRRCLIVPPTIQQRKVTESQICERFVKNQMHFTRWQIFRNSYKGLHLTLPLNLTTTEIIRVRLYEFIRISQFVKYARIGHEIVMLNGGKRVKQPQNV